MAKEAQQQQLVRVLYTYNAAHADELTIHPGDIIIVFERRADQWFRGNLHGKVGLFPGNYVQEL
ncbi:hypothetical protein I4U23_015130 [Adineta vaga]|nr:hypothetical protein I4U23_015130 [Adineta vaga]